MKKQQIIVLAVVVTVIASGIFLYKKWKKSQHDKDHKKGSLNETDKDIVSKTDDIVINEPIKGYKDSEAAADTTGTDEIVIDMSTDDPVFGGVGILSNDPIKG